MRLEGFIGPSYTLDSPEIDSQRCVNWYPKINEMGRGKSAEVAALIGTPGLSTLATVGTGPIRGSYTASNGFLYVVSGNELYYINSSWAAQLLGTMGTSTGQVDFADNGSTLVVVDGPNGYWHTFSSSTITAFSGASWLGSTTVNYLDGYFIFHDPDTGKFYISNLLSTTLDILDFSLASASPDNIVSILVNHREIWLFGESSIEAWYNTGNADFPFERMGGGFMEMGLSAAFSVGKIDKSTLWLGKNKEGEGIVYMAQGFTAQRISTHAVEKAIQSYGDISETISWTYQENGHSFYVLNFVNADTTWVFDLSTKLWHERAFLNKGKFERHKAICHSFAYRTHVVGDRSTGKIYKLDSNSYSDDGEEIKRLRRSPHISKELKRIAYSSFELEAETGTGLTGSAQGDDPKIILKWSDDGGHNWSNEKWAGFGKIGNSKKRVIWRRLGSSRDRIFEVSISDPVKANLIGAEIGVELMGH